VPPELLVWPRHTPYALVRSAVLRPHPPPSLPPPPRPARANPRFLRGASAAAAGWPRHSPPGGGLPAFGAGDPRFVSRSSASGLRYAPGRESPDSHERGSQRAAAAWRRGRPHFPLCQSSLSRVAPPRRKVDPRIGTAGRPCRPQYFAPHTPRTRARRPRPAGHRRTRGRADGLGETRRQAPLRVAMGRNQFEKRNRLSRHIRCCHVIGMSHRGRDRTSRSANKRRSVSTGLPVETHEHSCGLRSSDDFVDHALAHVGARMRHARARCRVPRPATRLHSARASSRGVSATTGQSRRAARSRVALVAEFGQQAQQFRVGLPSARLDQVVGVRV
jgi:hypothetical protein